MHKQNTKICFVINKGNRKCPGGYKSAYICCRLLTHFSPSKLKFLTKLIQLGLFSRLMITSHWNIYQSFVLLPLFLWICSLMQVLTLITCVRLSKLPTWRSQESYTHSVARWIKSSCLTKWVSCRAISCSSGKLESATKVSVAHRSSGA